MFDSLNVSNGVRQGSVLSPCLFAVYVDDLSKELNKINAGCIVGNLKFNHIMYADDLCCFCPSLSVLNELLAACSKYAVAQNIASNASKSYGMMFGVKYCKDFKPKLSLDGKIIKFVDSVKYLGVFLIDILSDDCDISYLFIYQVTSYHKKTAISSRSITKASRHAIPLKPTHKLAESKRYLVTW